MRRSPRVRHHRWRFVAVIAALALVVAACGDDDDDGDDGATGTTSGGEERGALVVGAKDFPSAQLVSQIYGQALGAIGYDVTFEDLGPTETTFAALESGDIDLYGEYQGTLLTFLGGEPTADADEVSEALDEALPEGVDASDPSGALDVNAFYVTEETAEQYDLETISDLAGVAGELVFGGPQECQERPLCLGDRSQELYGLEFAEVQRLDAGGPITVEALERGDIDVGLLFTGSSVIRDSFVMLEDDQGLQPADNVIAVWSDDALDDEAEDVIERINGLLTTDVYNELSLAIFNEQRDPDELAQEWLEENDLL